MTTTAAQAVSHGSSSAPTNMGPWNDKPPGKDKDKGPDAGAGAGAGAGASVSHRKAPSTKVKGLVDMYHDHLTKAKAKAKATSTADVDEDEDEEEDAMTLPSLGGTATTAPSTLAPSDSHSDTFLSSTWSAEASASSSSLSPSQSQSQSSPASCTSSEGPTHHHHHHQANASSVFRKKRSSTRPTNHKKMRHQTSSKGGISSSSSPTTATNKTAERQLEVASQLCAKGRTLWSMEDLDASLQHFRHALQILERILGQNHELTAKSQYWIGFLLKHQQNYPQALQAFRKTLRIRLLLQQQQKQQHQHQHQQGLKNTNKEQEDSPSTKEAITATAWVLKELGHDASLIESYLQNLRQSVDEEVQGRREMARLQTRGGATGGGSGGGGGGLASKAIAHFRQALDLEESGATLGSPYWSLLDGGVGLISQLALAHLQRGDVDPAIVYCRKALKVYYVHYGTSHPETVRVREGMEQILLDHYSSESSSSSSSLPMSPQRSALLFSKEIIANYCNSILLTSIHHQHLGDSYKQSGDDSRALEAYQQTLDLEEGVWGPHHPICAALQVQRMKHSEQDRNNRASREFSTTIVSGSGSASNLQTLLLLEELQRKNQELERQVVLQQQELVQVKTATLPSELKGEEENSNTSQPSFLSLHKDQVRTYRERSKKANEQVAQLEMALQCSEQSYRHVQRENLRLLDQLAVQESLSSASHSGGGGGDLLDDTGTDDGIGPYDESGGVEVSLGPSFLEFPQRQLELLQEELEDALSRAQRAELKCQETYQHLTQVEEDHSYLHEQWRAHVEQLTQRATVAEAQLSSVIANKNGPQHSKKQQTQILKTASSQTGVAVDGDYEAVGAAADSGALLEAVEIGGAKTLTVTNDNERKAQPLGVALDVAIDAALRETVRVHEELIAQIQISEIDIKSQHAESNLVETKSEEALLQAKLTDLGQEQAVASVQLKSAEEECKILRSEMSNLFAQIKDLKATQAEETEGRLESSNSTNNDTPTEVQKVQWQPKQNGTASSQSNSTRSSHGSNGSATSTAGSPQKGGGRTLVVENVNAVLREEPETIDQLESQWSEVERQLKVKDENVLTLRWKNDSLLRQIAQVGTARAKVQLQLEQARTQVRLCQKEKEQSSQRMALLHASKIELEALLGQTNDEVQEKLRTSDEANNAAKVSGNPSTHIANKKHVLELERLLFESKECVESLQQERQGFVSNIQELETQKAELEVVLLHTKERIAALIKDQETSKSRVASLESQQAEVEKQLLRSSEQGLKLSASEEASKMALETTRAALGQAEHDLELQNAEKVIFVNRIEALERQLEGRVQTIQSNEEDSLAPAPNLGNLCGCYKTEKSATEAQGTFVLRLQEAQERLNEAVHAKERAEISNSETELKLRKSQEQMEKLQLDQAASMSRIADLERIFEETDKTIKSETESMFSARLVDVEMQKAVVEGELQELHHKVLDLVAEKQAIVSSKEASLERLSSTTQNLEKAEEKVVSLQKVLSHAARKMQAEKESLSSRMVDLEAQKVHLERKLQDLQDNMLELTTEKEAAVKELKQAQEAAMAAELELNDANGKIEVLQSEGRIINVKYEEIQVALTEMKQKFEHKQQQAETLREENAVLKSRFDELSESSQQDAALMRSRVEQLIAKNKDLSREIDTSQTSQHAEIRILREEYDASLSRIREMESARLKLQQKLDLVEEQVRGLQSEKETLGETICVLESKNTEVKSHLEMAQQESMHLFGEMEGLRRKLEEVQCSKEGAERRLEDAQATSAILKEDKVGLESLLGAAEQKCESLRDQLDAARLQASEDTAAAMARIDELESARASLGAQLKALEKSVNLLQQEKASTLEKLLGSQIAFADLEHELAKTNADALTISQREKQLMAEVSGLKATNSELQELVQKSHAEVSLLESEKNKATQLVSELERSKKDREARLKEAEEVILILRSEKLSSESRHREFESRLNNSELEKKAVFKQLEDADLKIRNALQELKETSVSLISKESELTLLKARLDCEMARMPRSRSSSRERISKMAQSEGQQSHEQLFHQEKRPRFGGSIVQYEKALQQTELQISNLMAKIEVLEKHASVLDGQFVGEDMSITCKLKVQNERAANVIQSLSSELLAARGRQTKYARRLAGLKEAVVRLEKKNRSLKEEYGALERQSKAEKERVANKLSILVSTLEKCKREQNLRSNHASDNTDEGPKERSLEMKDGLDGTSSDIGTSTNLEGIFDANAERAIQLAPYRHETDLADYRVRRPFFLADDAALFATTSKVSSETYNGRFTVKRPSSVEVVATIKCDNSLLILTSRSRVRHRQCDGTWVDYGFADERDCPLGWVSYTQPDGNVDNYSLDDIFERTNAFREHYCNSVILATKNADSRILRLANTTQSAAFGKLIYAMLMCPDPQGRLFSFEKHQNVLLVAIAIVFISSTSLLAEDPITSLPGN